MRAHQADLYSSPATSCKENGTFPVSLRYCKDCSYCTLLQEGNSGICVGENTPVQT
jgi:hypothetical protein